MLIIGSIPCFIIFSSASAAGAASALELCFYTLIPSLFAFMVISQTAVQVLSGKKGPCPASRLLKTERESEAAVWLSFIGGYPVGICCVTSLYESGKITLGNARRLALSLVNPAPTFVISAVGLKMLGSIKAGIILAVSVYVSNIIISLALVFFRDLYGFSRKTTLTPSDCAEGSADFSKALVSSVSQASVTMLYICGFTVFFGALSSVICLVSDNPVFTCAVKGFLEVTIGCREIISNGFYSLPALSFVIAFGGMCVIMQILCFGKKLGLSPLHIIFVRLLSGLIASAVSRTLRFLYSPDISVLSNTPLKLRVAGNYGFFTTVMLLISIAVFLMTLKKSACKTRC